jgi:phenylacetate-CoA ligase
LGRKFFFKHLVYEPTVAVKAGRLGPRLRALERSQYWPRERLVELQSEKLQRLVAHAGRAVPFYRDRLGSGATSLRGLDDLARLPFLTKANLQAASRTSASEVGHGRLIEKTTGGSTGQPVTLWKTGEAWLWELAATWRGYAWAGIDIGDPQARFWGVPFSPSGRRSARLTDWICHRKRLSAFAFDDASLRRYVTELKRFRPKYFYGYVSMLEAFADFVESEFPTWDPELACIVTTSEVLTPAIRSRLGSVFKTRVFNEYGSGELGTVAHECPDGGFHLSEENLIVELLDGDRHCAPGEVGELVITEINNLAMPLIRYRTGDFATLASGECACGRTLRRLESVHGRAYDMIVNSAGRRFHGEFMMYVFEEIKRGGVGIKQFQVVQEAIDRFRVRVVKETGYGPDTERLVRRRIHEHVDPAAEVVFEEVDGIERSRSGKMRLIVGLGAP